MTIQDLALINALKNWIASLFPPKPTTFINRIVRSPENTYFTYPHSNGFMSDGRVVVARPVGPIQDPVANPTTLEYLAMDLNSEAVESLITVNNVRWYYAISKNNLMVAALMEGIVLVDLNKRTQKTLITYPGWTNSIDLDISPDGTKALVTRWHRVAPVDYGIDVVDTATGILTSIMRSPIYLDHAHFSPFDQNWICYCDSSSGLTTTRMWVWHATEAPKGRNIFNQILPDGKMLHVGHERAKFNDHAMVTVAFSDSTGAPRGLYQATFDGQVKLISESNSDGHCNVSPDGRWAVTSSMGKVLRPDGTLDLVTHTTSAWQNNLGLYGEGDVMLINMKTGARAFLYRSTVDVKLQPYEIQPAISPDGKWVVIKDAKEKRVLAIELNAQKMAEFLGN